MIKTTPILLEEYKDYANPTAKIRRLVEQGLLTPIIRGLYETDSLTPGYRLAPIIYGPSYLSYEFALAFHTLIPERVHVFTSATFGKRRSKLYSTPFGIFTYRDIPRPLYPLDLLMYTESGYAFQVASPEKALCDQLHKAAPLGGKRALQGYLFEDLRIDPIDFFALDKNRMLELALDYPAGNHKLLVSYLKEALS